MFGKNLVFPLIIGSSGTSTPNTNTGNNNQNTGNNTNNINKKTKTMDYSFENSNENKRQLLHWYRIIWNKLSNNSAEDIAQFAIIALLKDKMDLNSALLSIIEGIVSYLSIYFKQ
jgi:hypothetical protein